jgi:hypothetical protein
MCDSYYASEQEVQFCTLLQLSIMLFGMMYGDRRNLNSFTDFLSLQEDVPVHSQNSWIL